MSNPPVCHIPVDETITDQPRPQRFPPVPIAIDLASALAAINAMRLILQQLTGQTRPSIGINIGLAGGGGFNTRGPQGAQGAKGKAGKDAKTPKDPRWEEDRGQRVTVTKKIYQDNDKNSANWVEIKQINKVVWTDQVTGGQIVWERGRDEDSA